MRACLRWIPRLEADEAIRQSTVAAVGTGAISNARQISKGWERTAAGEDRTAGAVVAAGAPGQRRPALFSDEVLARLPVRRVPRKG